MRILDIKHGSQEWKDLRRLKIGASDFSAIMGINPWMTPYEKWLEKVEGKDIPVNKNMQRGIDQEPIALADFNSRWGRENPYKPCVALSDAHDWLMCSFDGWNGESAVEIKCPHSPHADIPDHYIPQLQAIMAVSGINECYFWSWVNDSGDPFVCKRDQEYIDKMLIKGREFYHRILNFDPPPLTDKDHKSMEGSQEWKRAALEWQIEYEKAKKQEIELELRRKKLIELSEGKSAMGYGVQLSISSVAGRVDFKAIPELINVDVNKYRKPKTERITITKKKEISCCN